MASGTSAWPTRALRLALDAAETYRRLGSPGELALAQAVVYLAVAPKVNAVYTAFKAARAFIAADGTRPVPLRLRNAPTRLMKQLDYGRGYRYAHDGRRFSPPASYWPEGMEPPSLPGRSIAGWRSASPRSWRNCAV